MSVAEAAGPGASLRPRVAPPVDVVGPAPARVGQPVAGARLGLHCSASEGGGSPRRAPDTEALTPLRTGLRPRPHYSPNPLTVRAPPGAPLPRPPCAEKGARGRPTRRQGLETPASGSPDVAGPVAERGAGL